jgi:hypothetical protein
MLSFIVCVSFLYFNVFLYVCLSYSLFPFFCSFLPFLIFLIMFFSSFNLYCLFLSFFSFSLLLFSSLFVCLPLLFRPAFFLVCLFSPFLVLLYFSVCKLFSLLFFFLVYVMQHSTILYDWTDSHNEKDQISWNSETASKIETKLKELKNKFSFKLNNFGVFLKTTHL